MNYQQVLTEFDTIQELAVSRVTLVKEIKKYFDCVIKLACS